MQITDLLVPERVALNMQVADKAMAIHAMVGMLDRTGCLRDAVEYEKNVLEREAQGTTGVGGGVAIPHGKSNAVLVLLPWSAFPSDAQPWRSGHQCNLLPRQ